MARPSPFSHTALRLVACGLAAIPALALAAQGPRPENRDAWISAGDYPRDAYIQSLEGTVGFAVAVDHEGRVVRCTVRQSSGVSALDAATCKLIAERARFAPATDQSGAKKSGVYASRVRWSIRQIDP